MADTGDNIYFYVEPTNKPFVDLLVLTEFLTDESKKPETSQPCAPQLLSASIHQRPRIDCTFGAVMRRHPTGTRNYALLKPSLVGAAQGTRQLSAPSAKTEVIASVNNS